MVINTKDNKCYMYAKKEVINEYKKANKAIEEINVTNSVKEKFLNDVLLMAYDDYQNKTNNLNFTINKSSKEDKSNATNVQKISNVIQKEDNYLNETDYNKQNNIYVVNGTFYIPKYTLSGNNCPSDPLNQGYNNPYGYNNYFYSKRSNIFDL